RFAAFADAFTHHAIALSPSFATLAGLHQYRDPDTGQSVDLDTELDDFSSQAIDTRIRFYQKSLDTLEHDFPARLLDEQERIDRSMLVSQCRLGLLDLTGIRSIETNPTVAVEAIGTALFFPVVLEYAPPARRGADVVARLRALPRFVEQAIDAMETSAPIYTEVAIEENSGNRDVIEHALPTLFPKGSPEEAAFLQARGPALAAIDRLGTFLEDDLKDRSTGDWRLGPDRYRDKLRDSFQDPDLDPVLVLRDAEAQMLRVRAEMMRLALPLHQEWFPSHGDHSGMTDPEARTNTVVLEVLERIGRDHVARGDLFKAIHDDLDRIAAFLDSHAIVSMTRHDTLTVIETPPFLRGIYSVAGLNPAPPLDPSLRSFFYVTPIPDDWSEAKVESKLREYNNDKLLLLSLHEGMPGHYTQLEYANRVQPEWRRLVRSVYGNNAYIEGWAQYAEEVMLQAGIVDPDDPKMRLTFLKEELRVLANAILDIRLHTLGMTDDEAMALMTQRAFQESQEAEGKLRRAKLSSAQLPTYYIGWRDWRRLRHDAEAARGASFDLRAFHDQVLSQGAIPMSALRHLMLPGEKAPASY
ncbi:MAG TPA: DUF885 domain-containing protein, partial [Candidatus Polarisedimenticolia bacterium]|nr:DUF885 domain-containing protein [Candidatus Polarisedimenticolia bacterium]